MQEPNQINNKSKLFFYLLSLAIFLTLLFWNAKSFDFLNFDDNIYVTQNRHVTSGMSDENFKWAFTTHHGGHWHPLTWLSLQLDTELFGVNATSSHLINLLFHLCNTILLFFLLVKLFKNETLAWFCALLFAVHPLRLESVIWITERKDVLSLFFGLLTLLAYVEYKIKGKRWYYGLTCCFLLLGLLAKPSLVVIPFLLPLLDFWLLKNTSENQNRTNLIEKIPFVLLCLLFSGIVYFTQKEVGGLKSFNHFTFAERIGSAFVNGWRYIGKTLWPSHLSIFYPFSHYSLLVMIAALIASVFVTVLFYKLRKKYPALFFGWSWFLISLLPVIGLVQIGGQSIADRWTYLPHIGLAIALCGFLNSLVHESKIKIYFLCATLLCLMTYKSSLELPNWKNSETIFRHALESNPDNFLAHNNLGVALADRGDFQSATFHYEESVRQNPFYSEALNNLGTMKAREGNLEGAKLLFQRALQQNQKHSQARYNLALTFYKLGNKIMALQGWLTLFHEDPTQATRSSLGFMIKNDFDFLCEKPTSDSGNSEELKNLFQILKWMNPQPKDEQLSRGINHWEECAREKLAIANISNLSSETSLHKPF